MNKHTSISKKKMDKYKTWEPFMTFLSYMFGTDDVDTLRVQILKLHQGKEPKAPKEEPKPRLFIDNVLQGAADGEETDYNVLAPNVARSAKYPQGLIVGDACHFTKVDDNPFIKVKQIPNGRIYVEMEDGRLIWAVYDRIEFKITRMLDNREKVKEIKNIENVEARLNEVRQEMKP